MTDIEAPQPGVHRVADVQLRGRSGPLPARAYWPVPTAAGSPPLVVLLPAAGGRDGLGWADARGRGLCAHGGAVVLSVGYRPPPGDPAAVEDAVTATWWAEDHAAELGADPDCLVVAAEGAAGGLAVAVARQARDDRWPPLARQVLVCAELGDHNTDEDGLRGLVAATVVTAGRGGGGTAARLRAAGVAVDELRYDDLRPEVVLAPGGGPLAERIVRDLGVSLRPAGREAAGWS